jgi:uncharacterized membrane protein YphA (DoxX/SURF4 family)
MKLRDHLNIIDNTDHPKWMLVIRVALGLSLMVKGIQFIQNNTLIREVFRESLILKNYLWLQTFIPWINLLGGVFIAIGLFTRLSVLFQIPILFGAIFFVNAKNGVYQGESNLFFSIIILVLLFVFIIQGGGKTSLDRAIKKKLFK